jgi:hypothetical protein
VNYHSSGEIILLRSLLFRDIAIVGWWLVADISGQHIFSIFQSEAVQESHRGEDVNYTAAET